MNRSNTTANSFDPAFLKAADPLSERAARAMRPNDRPAGLARKLNRNVITLQVILPDCASQVPLRTRDRDELDSFGEGLAENDDAR